MSITVRIRNESPYPLPAYQTAGAAGLDLRAHLKEAQVLQPGARALVGTGLYLEIPPGWEAQVRPRSGLALEYGLTILNSPGTIDSDYRGEIRVLLINLGASPVRIEPGMRIAQLVFAPVARVRWELVDLLSDSERGPGGFGHTGV